MSKENNHDMGKVGQEKEPFPFDGLFVFLKGWDVGCLVFLQPVTDVFIENIFQGSQEFDEVCLHCY